MIFIRYVCEFLSQKVESIVEKNYVTLSEDTYVGEAAKSNARLKMFCVFWLLLARIQMSPLGL